MVQDGEIEIQHVKSPSEILASNFWWIKSIHPWDVDFSKNETTEFHGLGWVSMSNVWVASAGRFASKEEMGKKNLLSPKKELGYERIITKLEKGPHRAPVARTRETTIAKKEIKLVC